MKDFLEQADIPLSPTVSLYSSPAPDACQGLDRIAQRATQKLQQASEMTLVIITNGWGLMMAPCILVTVLNM